MIDIVEFKNSKLIPCSKIYIFVPVGKASIAI